MAKHTLKILRYSQCKIFKICSAILQHYSWKGSNEKFTDCWTDYKHKTANTYSFKVENNNTMKRYEICSKLKIVQSVFIVNSEHISPLFRVFLFFSIWVFFHNHSQIIGLQGKGEDISPHYHFHPLHIHLDISRVITEVALHNYLSFVFAKHFLSPIQF